MTFALHATDPEGQPVVLALSRSDADLYDATKAGDFRRVGKFEIGTYIKVTDQTTGEQWEVASAPCGLGCHCAAVARRENPIQ